MWEIGGVPCRGTPPGQPVARRGRGSPSTTARAFGRLPVTRALPLSEPEPNARDVQALEVVAGVRLDGVRSVVVVRDAAEPVE